MHRTILAASATFAAVIAGFVALATIPQVSEWYIEASCSSKVPSTSCRARMLQMGHTWSQDGNFRRAMVWYSRVADAGEPAGMFHLAWSYQQLSFAEPHVGQPDRLTSVFNLTPTGERLPPAPMDPQETGNMEKAALWYERAAASGFAPAMNNLGQIALLGMRGKRNLQEALRWHLAAAKAGNPIAALNLSMAYRQGMGVPVDKIEAQKWARVDVPENSSDIEPLILQRTMIYGSSPGAQMAAALRSAAIQHEAFEASFAPLRPSADTPTFNNVDTPYSGEPPATTLRQLRP